MDINYSFEWIGFDQGLGVEEALESLLPKQFSQLEADAILAQLEEKIERLVSNRAKRLIEVKEIRTARDAGLKELRLAIILAGNQRQLRLYFAENPIVRNHFLGVFFQLKTDGLSSNIRNQQNDAIQVALGNLTNYLKGLN
jgi:hypothetical protein